VNPYALEIYTDGSSKVKLGCKASCAFVVVYPEQAGERDPESYDWSYDKSKIVAMEISAINRALEWLGKEQKKLKEFNVFSVLIYCDNQSVVDTANKHVFYWAQKGWKKRDGGDIANIDAWKKYMNQRRKISGLSIEIKWIKGKSTTETVLVDKIAKSAAEGIPRYKSTDFMPFKVADRLDPSQLFKEIYNGPNGVMIRVYYHQSVNKKKNSEYKVYFEVIEDEKVKEASIAYCTREFNREYIDRKNYYIANFNKVGNYQTIFTKATKIKGKKLINIKSKLKKHYGRC
jgi:ribonuclease HI